MTPTVIGGTIGDGTACSVLTTARRMSIVRIAVDGFADFDKPKNRKKLLPETKFRRA
jgi:hypothetical protein